MQPAEQDSLLIDPQNNNKVRKPLGELPIHVGWCTHLQSGEYILFISGTNFCLTFYQKFMNVGVTQCSAELLEEQNKPRTGYISLHLYM
jgi:hypothetical protein